MISIFWMSIFLKEILSAQKESSTIPEDSTKSKDQIDNNKPTTPSNYLNQMLKQKMIPMC